MVAVNTLGDGFTVNGQLFAKNTLQVRRDGLIVFISTPEGKQVAFGQVNEYTVDGTTYTAADYDQLIIDLAAVMVAASGGGGGGVGSVTTQSITLTGADFAGGSIALNVSTLTGVFVIPNNMRLVNVYQVAKNYFNVGNAATLQLKDAVATQLSSDLTVSILDVSLYPIWNQGLVNNAGNPNIDATLTIDIGEDPSLLTQGEIFITFELLQIS